MRTISHNEIIYGIGDKPLMNVFLLCILGILTSMFIPLGGIIIFAITFAVVILNYKKTNKIHEDIKMIRRHLGLMEQREEEEYEFEKHLNDHERNQIDSLKLAELNDQIEKELEKELDKEKDKDK